MCLFDIKIIPELKAIKQQWKQKWIPLFCLKAGYKLFYWWHPLFSPGMAPEESANKPTLLASSLIFYLPIVCALGNLSCFPLPSCFSPNLLFFWRCYISWNAKSLLWVTFLVFFSFMRRRQWHPTPVLLPGKSHGRRSLVACSWATEQLHFHAPAWCALQALINCFSLINSVKQF